MHSGELRAKAIDWMIQRGWKRLTAKRRGFEQSLLEHTMVEVDALISLLPILRRPEHFAIEESEEKILIASIIAHDAGKEKGDWQEYLFGKGSYISDVDQELTRKIVPELCLTLGFQDLGDKVLNVIENCINLHMRRERGDANVVHALLRGGDRWKTLADLVDAIDNVCSAKGLFGALTALERSILNPHLKTVYHQIVFRGVSTPMVHRACLDTYIKNGWSPFLFFGNGTLYVYSAAEDLVEPALEEIEAQLAKIMEESFGSDLSNLMVGSPVANILPKPDLLDRREVKQYLLSASRTVKRTSFLKKKEPERAKVVKDYLRMKGERSEKLSGDIIDHHSQRIDSAYPQMAIFKFFKAIMDEKLVGAEGRKIAAKEYEEIFGQGSWKALQNTSTLMAAKDMSQCIDYFWILPGNRLGFKADRIEDLADEKKDELLINLLDGITEKVFSSIENSPSRADLAQKMARAFMKDLVKPRPAINLKELAEQQWEAYGLSKPFAGKTTKKAQYFCPLCNVPFREGVKASANFLDNPQSHTNRAISHGPFGYVMICETCKYERFLRQILLGGKPAEMVVLFPRMNIGYTSGEILVRKVNALYQKAYSLMVGNSDDPGHQITLALTHLLARNAMESTVDQLTGEELAEVLSYRSAEDTRKKMRRALEKRIKGEIGETVEDLNREWGMEFATWDEAIDALIGNRINEPVARSIRAEVYHLVPQMKVICQTPNMLLIPLLYPLSLGKESETNSALRKLFTTLLIGLALDMTVAIIGDTDEIDFEGGEGVAFVPPVPSVRNLIGSNWVSIEEAQKWLRAIGASSILAGATSYPERSNLFSILSAPTPGHILRRIEEKAENRRASYFHINYIEMVKEVLH